MSAIRLSSYLFTLILSNIQLISTTTIYSSHILDCICGITLTTNVNQIYPGWSCTSKVSDVCSLPGMTCSSLSDDIIAIDLSSKSLSGKIHSCFDLSGNHLTGNLPGSLGLLKSLTSLSLHSNALSGSIPAEISLASSLQAISLYDNHLTGSIPSAITNLEKLESLYLYSNYLSGTIPANIGALSSLIEFAANDNNISGSIPTSLCYLKSLLRFDAFNNKLRGQLPTVLGTLVDLQVLRVNGNSLSGSIPASIGHLSSLFSLKLFSNHISGSIPHEIGYCTSLEFLFLDHNSLIGSIPSSFGYLGNLQFLRLSTNSITGSIPDSLRYLRSLQVLHIYENKLSGSLFSDEYSSMLSLTELQIYSNFFTGRLSENLCNNNLKLFYAQNNPLISCYSSCLDSIPSLNFDGISSCSPTFSPTEAPTTKPSAIPSLWPTGVPSAVPSGQPSAQPSNPKPTTAPTVKPSAAPSVSPSGRPSSTPIGTPSNNPSSFPSKQPSGQPSSTPSARPSSTPTIQPTGQPSGSPSAQPSGQPSSQPSAQPTASPSNQPSNAPSASPSGHPTILPSSHPSSQPSRVPTPLPSRKPSLHPSEIPSTHPSGQPSASPSSQPSMQPTYTPSSQPSGQPSAQPSSQPSASPSAQPSKQPSTKPSGQPTSVPSTQPSGQPSSRPSTHPTYAPSSQPSGNPSTLPSTQPSSQPSAIPTKSPTYSPSVRPTRSPSVVPTSQPSGSPTARPTGHPSTKVPSTPPSAIPSGHPSEPHTNLPTEVPSNPPTKSPHDHPSNVPIWGSSYSHEQSSEIGTLSSHHTHYDKTGTSRHPTTRPVWASEPLAYTVESSPVHSPGYRHDNPYPSKFPLWSSFSSSYTESVAAESHSMESSSSNQMQQTQDEFLSSGGTSKTYKDYPEIVSCLQFGDGWGPSTFLVVVDKYHYGLYAPSCTDKITDIPLICFDSYINDDKDYVTVTLHSEDPFPWEVFWQVNNSGIIHTGSVNTTMTFTYNLSNKKSPTIILTSLINPVPNEMTCRQCPSQASSPSLLTPSFSMHKVTPSSTPTLSPTSAEDILDPTARPTYVVRREKPTLHPTDAKMPSHVKIISGKFSQDVLMAEPPTIYPAMSLYSTSISDLDSTAFMKDFGETDVSRFNFDDDEIEKNNQASSGTDRVTIVSFNNKSGQKISDDSSARDYGSKSGNKNSKISENSSPVSVVSFTSTGSGSDSYPGTKSKTSTTDSEESVASSSPIGSNSISVISYSNGKSSMVTSDAKTKNTETNSKQAVSSQRSNGGTSFTVSRVESDDNSNIDNDPEEVVEDDNDPDTLTSVDVVLDPDEDDIENEGLPAPDGDLTQQFLNDEDSRNVEELRDESNPDDGQIDGNDGTEVQILLDERDEEGTDVTSDLSDASEYWDISTAEGGDIAQNDAAGGDSGSADKMDEFQRVKFNEHLATDDIVYADTAFEGDESGDAEDGYRRILSISNSAYEYRTIADYPEQSSPYSGACPCFPIWLGQASSMTGVGVVEKSNPWYHKLNRGAQYFVSDMNGEHLIASGSPCDMEVRFEDKNMIRCSVCLPHGNYRWRVTGALDERNSRAIAWEFCDVKGGSESELKFSIDRYCRCVPLVNTQADEICKKNSNDEPTESPTTTLEATFSLHGTGMSVLMDDASNTLRKALAQEFNEAMSSSFGAIQPSKVTILESRLVSSGDEDVTHHRVLWAPEVNDVSNAADDTLLIKVLVILPDQAVIPKQFREHAPTQLVSSIRSHFYKNTKASSLLLGKLKIHSKSAGKLAYTNLSKIELVSINIMHHKPDSMSITAIAICLLLLTAGLIVFLPYIKRIRGKIKDLAPKHAESATPYYTAIVMESSTIGRMHDTIGQRRDEFL